MTRFIVNLLYFSCLLFVPIKSVKESEDTLKLVHVFFRHGDRTPDSHEMYPNDIYNAENFQPIGFGQLTRRGLQRSYQLGKLLRQRYEKFLGNIYYQDILEMQSTDYDRTKMSALLVLAGLFPPSVSQEWNNQLLWSPIPYHYEKADRDYFLRRPTHYCPKYVEELNKITKSDEYKKILDYYTSVLNYMSQFTGKNITSLHDAFGIYQTLHAEENMNLTLPSWTKRIYPDILSSIAGKQCEFENYNVLLRRLNGGRSLQTVLKHIKLKISNDLKPSRRKMYLYSGHENNVINILATLGIMKVRVVEFSSAAIIELHYLEESKSYAVKILFVKSVYEEPIVETIPGCKKMCLLDNFLDIIDIYVPKNYTKECNSAINLQ